MPSEADPPRIVLVGCSFAGLEFLYRYVRIRRRLAPGELTVVEPRSHHPYIPLAHEAASGAASAESLRFDVEAFCTAIGVAFVRGAATGVDTRERLVHVAERESLPYDRLVVAVGSEPAIPASLAARSLVPAKWVADAVALHDWVRARHATGAPARVAIVGTGITGVEWAAELAGSTIAGSRAVVSLIGLEQRLLATFAPGIARHAAELLDGLGVRCHLRRTATDVTADAIVLDDGQRVPIDVAVWAGGVRPNELSRRLGLPVTTAGHVIVTPRLAVPNGHGVYAIGDVARVTEGGAIWPTMERAIEAIWQGALLARRLAGRWDDDRGPRHRLRREFFYGLSLGPRHSLVLYGRLWVDTPLFVHFRRWLKWAYYTRFALLARWVSARRRPRQAEAA